MPYPPAPADPGAPCDRGRAHGSAWATRTGWVVSGVAGQNPRAASRPDSAWPDVLPNRNPPATMEGTIVARSMRTRTRVMASLL
jgi:hypothetical protein